MKAPGPVEPRGREEAAGDGLPVPYGGAAGWEHPGGVDPRAVDGRQPGPEPGDTQPGGPGSGGTVSLDAVPDGPADADLGLFADDRAAPRAPRGPGGPRESHHPRAVRRRRRLTLVLTVGGVVAALGVGLLGSGLFTDDGGGDRAVPRPDTITAVPTGGGTEPAPEESHGDGTSAAPDDGDGDGDGPEPSATASERPGTGADDPGGETTQRSEAGRVTAAPPAADPTEADDPTSGTTPGGRDNPAPPPTLREGDSGPEVVELEKRLFEAGHGGLIEDTDGEYDYFTRRRVEAFQQDEGIEGDEPGVYGPATRRALESMTKEP